MLLFAINIIILNDNQYTNSYIKEANKTGRGADGNEFYYIILLTHKQPCGSISFSRGFESGFWVPLMRIMEYWIRISGIVDQNHQIQLWKEWIRIRKFVIMKSFMSDKWQDLLSAFRIWIRIPPDPLHLAGSGSTSISFLGSGSGSTEESIDLDPGNTKTI